MFSGASVKERLESGAYIWTNPSKYLGCNLLFFFVFFFGGGGLYIGKVAMWSLALVDIISYFSLPEFRNADLIVKL